MKFSDLPVGATVISGLITDTGHTRDDPEPFSWKKVKNGKLILMDDLGSFIWLNGIERGRPSSGTNRDQRTYGHRSFFALTDFAAWLNGGNEWFRDEPNHYCWYNDQPGFLNSFTEKELAAMRVFHERTEVPPGYNKKYGKIFVRDVRVTLPSLSELGCTTTDEGDQIFDDYAQLMGFVHPASSIVSRSPYDNHQIAQFSIVRMIAQGAGDARSISRGFHPIIEIDPDTEVFEAGGYYYIDKSRTDGENETKETLFGLLAAM